MIKRIEPSTTLGRRHSGATLPRGLPGRKRSAAIWTCWHGRVVFNCITPMPIAKRRHRRPSHMGLSLPIGAMTAMAVREAAISIISLWGQPTSFVDAILSFRRPLPSVMQSAAA